MDPPASAAQLNSDPYAWAPFAIAIFLTLATPLTNYIWLGSYESYYDTNFPNANPTRGQLRAGAEWAVEIASAVPNFALTLLGIVMLKLPLSPKLVLLILIVGMVMLFSTAAYVARQQQLTDAKKSLKTRYSLLSLLQILLNLVGIVVAVAS